jgi:hypothetical protein
MPLLSLTDDFQADRDALIAAMLFPSSEAYRTGYLVRRQWERRVVEGGNLTVSTSDAKNLLDAPSRAEMRDEARDGTKRGTVAGDLLSLIYVDWRRRQPEPSLRSALLRYREWAIGRKYGDSSPLLYSDAQLRRYLCQAEPSAHLWAALRLLKRVDDGEESYRAAFSRHGMMFFLGVARELQDFATTFVPKRAKPPKPVVAASTLFQIPVKVSPIELDLGPL